MTPRMPWDAQFDKADELTIAAMSHPHGSDGRELLLARANLYRADGARQRAANSTHMLTWTPADPEARTPLP